MASEARVGSPQGAGVSRVDDEWSNIAETEVSEATEAMVVKEGAPQGDRPLFGRHARQSIPALAASAYIRNGDGREPTRPSPIHNYATNDIKASLGAIKIKQSNNACWPRPWAETRGPTPKPGYRDRSSQVTPSLSFGL